MPQPSLPARAALWATVFSGLSAHAMAAPVRFDFNTAGSPTQATWIAAPVGLGTDGTVSVATIAVGGASLDTRDRPGINTDGAGADIGNDGMWRDFIFANGSFNTLPGSGLEITITGLVPDATYPLRLWAFDESSNISTASPASAGRAADWTTGAESATLVFPSAPDPPSLDDYTVTLLGVADGSGTIVLTGVVTATNPDASHNVFLNGLEIGDVIGDADGDGMQDAFEQDIIDADPLDGLVTIHDVLPGDDFDMDGSSNQAEETRGTSPINPDSDGDGVFDGAEDGGGVWVSATMRGTNPLATDSDNDGLPDGVENPDLPYNPDDPQIQPGSDPNLVDTDGDGSRDLREVSVDGTDPTDPNDVFDPLADAVARFDFNAPGSPVQAGWTAADLGTGSDGTVGVITEVLTGGGAVTLDTRDRDTLTNTDDPGADVSNSDLWRDFVFAAGSFDSVPGSGLRVTLTGLLPLTSYPIRIWAFDDSSNTGRFADWGVAGEAPAATLGFPTSPDPLSLLDYFIELNAATDAAGQLVLEGVVAANLPSISHNVFVNALVVGAPNGSTLPVITSIEYDPEAGTATVTWTSLPGRVYAFDSSNNLEQWSELSDNVASQGATTSYTEIGLTPADDPRFFRVRVVE